jgi:hypothetical protein
MNRRRHRQICKSPKLAGEHIEKRRLILECGDKSPHSKILALIGANLSFDISQYISGQIH